MTSGSSRKVWWKCKKGHELSAPIIWRNKGIICLSCNGIKELDDKSLQVANPLLAEEWHPKKNRRLAPKDLSQFSNKRVWWIRPKGHEYQSRISRRNDSRGCPICRSKKIHTDNCLQTRNPKLVTQWHHYKNGKLTPKDVMPFSMKKVWWRCDR